MSSVYAKCPECGESIPGPTQAQANRNLGLHRRSKHGYVSPDYEASQKYHLNYKRKVQEGGKAVVALQAKAERIAQLNKAREARWGKAPLSQTPAAVAKRTEAARAARWAGHEKLSKTETQRAWREKKRLEQAAQGYRYSPEQREKRKQYQENYRAKRKAAMAALANNSSPDKAQPCKLNQCPECGARFYVVRGQQA